MPRHILFSSVAVCLLLSSAASAGHHKPVVEAPPGPPPERTIINRQIILVPQEEAVALPALRLREIEIGLKPSLELDFIEKKEKVIELELKECEVEQKVVCKEMKAVTVKDPCTGKCHIDYEPCEVVKCVKVKVYKPVEVCREVVVRVPVLKEGPPMSVRKLVLDELCVPAIKTTYGAAERVNVIPVPPSPPWPELKPFCPTCRPLPPDLPAVPEPKLPPAK